jgi:hypothetical protein
MRYWGNVDTTDHFGCQCSECKVTRHQPHDRCMNCGLLLAPNAGDECETCRLFTAQVANLHEEPGRS